jgi:hypothetical protein
MYLVLLTSGSWREAEEPAVCVVTLFSKPFSSKDLKLFVWTFRIPKVKCGKVYWNSAFFPSSGRERFIQVIWLKK